MSTPSALRADDATKRLVISALRKMLSEASLEAQLRFLHKIRVRFTLTTTDKGNYHCRVFKQYKNDGAVTTLCEYQAGGKSPHAALLNAICDFLTCEDGDYHDFVHDDWAGKSGHSSTASDIQRTNDD